MSLIKRTPVVFAVGEDYQIAVPVTEPCVMWVRIGDECFYDASNGILKSLTDLHWMTTPMSKLDRAKEYTVCYRRIIERKPYFSELEDITEETYSFRPVPNENPVAYHIADAHGAVASPVEACHLFEDKVREIDFLILNGDVIDHSGDLKNFDTIYEISSLLTKGEKPVIFSRGNHDTRGIYAEKIADYTPTRDGFSYFSFRLGSIWGLVVDCAEDKLDDCEEYGHTICCHDFRRKETEYIESVIKNAEREYLSEGVTQKLIITHTPFTRKNSPPFDIEIGTYTYWAKLIKENIKPNLMICGHTHKFSIDAVGSEKDSYGQPCTVVVASQPDRSKGIFGGAGFVFAEGSTRVVFTDNEKIINDTEVK